MERPALQQLLADIRAGKIAVVVAQGRVREGQRRASRFYVDQCMAFSPAMGMLEEPR